MGKLWHEYKWIPATVVGSLIFAMGFSFFLAPNDMSPGGISGLALVVVELLQVHRSRDHSRGIRFDDLIKW